MTVLAHFTLLCIVAATAASPIGLTGTRKIFFMDKSDVISTKSLFESLISIRIVNGKPATAGQFPHQVGLILAGPEGKHLCGGTLVTDTWVLSAAHCVLGKGGVGVILGGLVTGGDANSVTIPGAQALYHIGYDSVSKANDVAVIQLSRPAPISNYIKTITLDRDTIVAGSDLVISGYGRISDDSSSSLDSKLIWATVKSISNSECSSFFGSIPEGVICTEDQSNESVCRGDSGGPLVLVKENSVSQVGITSFVSSLSCERGYPTAFTRVSNYYDCIQAAIGSEM